MWGLKIFRFYLYGKKVFFYTDHQALEPLIKRNRCNRQYSARLTRWLDRLAHFDIAIQHIAGSILKFTDFLSRNPVKNATTEAVYDEQYVMNILSEQVELNRKYGVILDDQSQNATERSKTTETNFNDQSQRHRAFEKNREVNKKHEQAKLTTDNRRQKANSENPIQKSNQNSSSNQISLQILPLFKTDMYRDYFHWGATAEIMEIIRKRRKSLETLRLVERRLETSRSGTIRRKFDMNARRPNNSAKRIEKEAIGNPTLPTCRIYKDGSGSQNLFFGPNMQKEIEEKAKNCVACMASGKNLKYQTRIRKTKNNNGAGTTNSN